MPPDIVSSVCPHDCPSTCALDVERLDARRIGRIHGARDNPYTAGIVCAKVARYAERVHHPDRLSHPLRRIAPKGVGGGRKAFEEISWDAALDLVARKFGEASRRHGPEAVWPYYYAGTMGLLQRDGIGRLRHVLGYSRQHPTICSALANAGWVAGAGVKRGLNPREMADSDLIILWGTNAVATQINVMTHVAHARKKRGAKLVVVDPYRTATAEAADLHLSPRPGTDGALACAMMHVLFDEGLEDRDYLARYTDAPDLLELHLLSRTPDWAAAITGLESAEIVDFARLYGKTKRSFLRLGFGFTRQRNGAANMHAVSCLPAVTGAWRERGGGALYNNSALYSIDKTLIEGLDALDTKTRVLDMSRIGPILTGEQSALGSGPPVTAMLIQNTNPAAVAPESTKVRQGLLRDDLFLCVHEQFLTETAELADVVLPATSFLEHNDIYLSGGHTHLQIARQAIEPHGKSRSNHAVICGLAERLGAEHPGFHMTEWDILDRTLRASGYIGADELAEKRWLDCAPDFETAHFLNGFGHGDGKFHFAPDWEAIGPDHALMPELPDHMPVIEEADAEHPFRLVTAPARGFLNTSFTETPTSQEREGQPTALIHPDDCRELGLVEGERVRIGNRRGSLLVRVRSFDGLQRKVVVVEGIWPNVAFDEGRGINVLVGADPGPPNGGAVFHDSAVWLRQP
jgi:anaerobic selenocysteine-containing dehydrogenase